MEYLTVPHGLLEAGLEVGHSLEVLSPGSLIGRKNFSNFLEQLPLSAWVTGEVENSPQQAVGSLEKTLTERERQRDRKQEREAERGREQERQTDRERERERDGRDVRLREIL